MLKILKNLRWTVGIGKNLKTWEKWIMIRDLDQKVIEWALDIGKIPVIGGDDRRRGPDQDLVHILILVPVQVLQALLHPPAQVLVHQGITLITEVGGALQNPKEMLLTLENLQQGRGAVIAISEMKRGMEVVGSRLATRAIQVKVRIFLRPLLIFLRSIHLRFRAHILRTFKGSRISGAIMVILGMSQLAIITHRTHKIFHTLRNPLSMNIT